MVLYLTLAGCFPFEVRESAKQQGGVVAHVLLLGCRGVVLLGFFLE